MNHYLIVMLQNEPKYIDKIITELARNEIDKEDAISKLKAISVRLEYALKRLSQMEKREEET